MLPQYAPDEPGHGGQPVTDGRRWAAVIAPDAAWYARGVRRGKVLAIKWGMNPNSSSLGVDVTFLLLGATVLAAMTPVVGAVLRWRRKLPEPE
ncbi:MAG TPA: hypothetical protein VFP84_26810 [Kofleriaceae bacterium]|nr:hypothetical protein [Kofleriaceae bacterium]